MKPSAKCLKKGIRKRRCRGKKKKKTAGGNLPISQLVQGEVWNDISPKLCSFFHRTKASPAKPQWYRLSSVAARCCHPTSKSRHKIAFQHRLSGLILPHSLGGFSLLHRTSSRLLCWLLVARNILGACSILVSALQFPSSVPAPSSPQELQSPLEPRPSVWASKWNCWRSLLSSSS